MAFKVYVEKRDSNALKLYENVLSIQQSKYCDDKKLKIVDGFVLNCVEENGLIQPKVFPLFEYKFYIE